MPIMELCPTDKDLCKEFPLTPPSWDKDFDLTGVPGEPNTTGAYYSNTSSTHRSAHLTRVPRKREREKEGA